MLDVIRLEYDIEKGNVIATVTDNASHFVKAFKEFGKPIEEYDEHDEIKVIDSDNECCDDDGGGEDDNRVDNVYIEDFNDDATNTRTPHHVRCASHTLSLIATIDGKNALKDVEYKKIYYSLMDKLSSLWYTAGKPRSAESIRNILGEPLTIPVITRWNSYYYAMKDLLLFKKETIDILFKELDTPILTDNEYYFITEYVLVSTPIANTLAFLLGDVESFYGCLIPTIFVIEKNLEKLEDLRYCSPLKLSLLDGLKTRFKDYLNLSVSIKPAIIATISDPRFKLKWLPINKEHMKNELIDMLTDEVRQVTYLIHR